MPAKGLPAYRIARAAQEELDEIWLYSARQWSNEQADRYLDGLYDCFDLLQRHPLLAREWTAIDPPVRLHPHRSHLIVYRIQDKTLVIVRVLHLKSDWQATLESDQV